MGRVDTHTVDASGYDEGEELLARPQGLGLEDAGHGQLSVPGGEEHDERHHLLLVQEHVSLGHFTDGRQGVLDDAHARLVGLRRDDLARSQVNVENFRTSLHRLGNVQIHLVAVEIGVVRRRVAQIHSENKVVVDQQSKLEGE